MTSQKRNTYSDLVRRVDDLEKQVEKNNIERAIILQELKDVKDAQRLLAELVGQLRANNGELTPAFIQGVARSRRDD